MLEITNLNKCKEHAKILLNMEYTIVNSDIFPILSHPIINDTFIPDKNGGVLNILEDEEAYNKLIKKYTELIGEAEDYNGLMIFIRNPYKLFFIKITKEFLSLKDFSTNLIESWVVDENANDNINVSKDELVQYFKEASKEFLMETEDMKVYSSFDDIVTVYRGLNTFEKSKKAMSWSLSIETAKWFASRFNNNGNVYKAKVKKEDILAYCDRRNEKEVIVNYKKVYGIELLKYKI